MREIFMKKLALLSGLVLLSFIGIQASPQYDDLVKLVKSNAGEEVIVAFVNASDSSYNLSSDEITHLKEYGASSKVIITAIQHKGSGHVISNTQAEAVPPETASVTPPSSRYVVYRTVPPWRLRRAGLNSLYWQNIEKMKQALQVDVYELMFGSLALNYEYLFGRQHGIVVEGNYFTGWDAHGENGELEYRWHWAGSMNSGFLGVFLNGGRLYGSEHYTDGSIASRYTMTSITFGPDLGYRWVFPFGLNSVARIGYGYPWCRFDNPAPDQSTMDQLRANASVDFELSLGYAF